MNGIAEQMTVFVEQAEIHAPCVYTDGSDILMLTESALVKRAFYLMENTQYIPCKFPVCHDGFIRKTVNFIQRDLFAVEAPDDTSAARSAEVYGKRFQFFHCMYFLSI